MRVECVTVSVNCGDFLRFTLPHNRPLFNRTIVVTSEADKEIQQICKYYNVECLPTNVMYDNGAKFNKGRAINEGLTALGFKEWVVHLDADMVLPPLTRHILENLSLNEQFMYGVDRLMVPSYEHWEKFINAPLPQHEMAYVHVGPFPVGTRLFKVEQGGYVPLGYFQMFHRASNYLGKPPFYPTEWGNAATSDLYFAYRWPRTHRHLLPEVAAFHLATEEQSNAKMGVNWDGRVTGRFGPKDPIWGNFRRSNPVLDPGGKATTEQGRKNA